MQKFILIGGAPTTGKSTLTKQLANRLGMPWMSTDQLRSVVRPYGTAERFPTLYDTEGVSAEEFLAKYAPQEIADMEFAQGDDVWPAVKALIAHDYDWMDGAVIEGVNILPHLVAQLDAPLRGLVRPVFLVDLDEERMRKVVYTRGLYAKASEYSDDVKESEVQWAMIFARRLKAEAEKHGFPCIDVSKTDADVDAVLAVVNRKASSW